MHVDLPNLVRRVHIAAEAERQIGHVCRIDAAVHQVVGHLQIFDNAGQRLCRSEVELPHQMRFARNGRDEIGVHQHALYGECRTENLRNRSGRRVRLVEVERVGGSRVEVHRGPECSCDGLNRVLAGRRCEQQQVALLHGRLAARGEPRQPPAAADTGHASVVGADVERRAGCGKHGNVAACPRRFHQHGPAKTCVENRINREDRHHVRRAAVDRRAFVLSGRDGGQRGLRHVVEGVRKSRRAWPCNKRGSGSRRNRDAADWNEASRARQVLDEVVDAAAHVLARVRHVRDGVVEARRVLERRQGRADDDQADGRRGEHFQERKPRLGGVHAHRAFHHANVEI